MLADIKPPRKKTTNSSSISKDFVDTEKKTQLLPTKNEHESAIKEKKSAPKFYQQLAILSYLLFVLTMLNFSAIKNFFINIAKNHDVAIASENDYTLSTDKSYGQNLPTYENNHLYIPSLNIEAPITWNVLNNDTKIQAALLNGVIQIDGTALPGQNGNIYITGHSSSSNWKKSDYKTIFAKINELKNDDPIYIKKDNIVYAYVVTEQKILAATDFSLFNANLDYEQLSLVTCWPIGTDSKRLAVIAKRVK